jgi:hypothetical protein
MAERDQQGTGRHPHKDSAEPWPHTKEQGNQGGGSHERTSRSHRGGSHGSQQGDGSRDGSQHGGGSQSGGHKGSESSSDLKQREYRDEKGEVHHHTRTYMEQHGDGSRRKD